MINGTPKADIDSCFDCAKSHIKPLTENQLKEMQSVLTLDTRDFEYAQDIGNNTGNTTRR